jgi:hypothetical protein
MSVIHWVGGNCFFKKKYFKEEVKWPLRGSVVHCIPSPKKVKN